tara:strand:- start:278 stop:697 length:420 start_codon:yes stop_codon:yes gene_type:complete
MEKPIMAIQFTALLEGLSIRVNPKLKDADQQQIKYTTNKNGGVAIPLDIKGRPFSNLISETEKSDKLDTSREAWLNFDKDGNLSHISLTNVFTGESYTLFASCGIPSSDKSPSKPKLKAKKTGKSVASEDTDNQEMLNE